MSRKITFSLDSFNRWNLQEIIARGDNWRERQRANTLIRLDDGLTMQEVANEVGIHVRTVGLTRMHWIAKGINALKDAFRPGAPMKIKPDQVDKFRNPDPVRGNFILFGTAVALFFCKIHIPSLVNSKKSAKNSATSIPTGSGFLKLKEAASLEPLTAKELLVKHIEGGGTPVHLNTIKDALKRANFVWKRTRSFLKKNEMRLHSEQVKLR